MALICFPGALNPFCRPSVCISACSDHVALATSSSILYLYSYCEKNLLFRTKFIPHSKSLSCMAFHPTIPGLLVTGGAPSSRIILWSVEGKIVERQVQLSLQRRPNAITWLSNEDLIIGDEHGSVYRWTKYDQKLVKLSPTTVSEKANDEVQFFALANKQNFILTIAYKSGLVGICHVDLENNHLNVLHKLLPESANTICCSIQFAHMASPLERSTLFYISYAHGCIKVCDYANGKIISQLVLMKQSKTSNFNDPRCRTYYPLVWLDANTLLTGNSDGHLIRIDVRHSSHLEKSQLNVTPPVSGGKPIFSLGIKDQNKLFTYSFNRKLAIYDLESSTLVYNLMSIPGAINSIQACPLQTSCVALGVDTGNIGLLDLSTSGSSALSFLWQSIPADVCRIAWHPIREGRVAYSTRLGHVGLYDTLSGRSRVVYDWSYTQPGSPTSVLWGPLIPGAVEDPSLAILYTVGDGKFHRWDSPEKCCIPTELTFQVQESNSPIVTVAFSDDHKYLSVICLDGSLWLRSCPSMTAIHRLSTQSLPTFLLYHPRYLLSSVDASIKQYWVAVNDKHKIQLINTLDSTSSTLTALNGHTADIECLVWSSTFDFMLASGSQDKTIRLWNVDTCSPLKIYIEHFDTVTSILFSSSDPHVIISSSRDQALHIWHIEQHTQSPDQPIATSIVGDDEESTSNDISKQKRNHKPRPNRAEREKKRAAKAISAESGTDPDDRQVSSANQIMNELNSLAYRLLWPTAGDHGSLSDLSSLPDKTTVIERIKQLVFESSNDLIYHMLYWSGAFTELSTELCKANQTSVNRLFFWMAILNDNNEKQPLFDQILDRIKENHQEYVLEFVTMMVKAKRTGQIFEYLLHQDHVESSLLLAVLCGSIDEIRDRLTVSLPNKEA